MEQLYPIDLVVTVLHVMPQGYYYLGTNDDIWSELGTVVTCGAVWYLYLCVAFRYLVGFSSPR